MRNYDAAGRYTGQRGIDTSLVPSRIAKAPKPTILHLTATEVSSPSQRRIRVLERRAARAVTG